LLFCGAGGILQQVRSQMRAAAAAALSSAAAAQLQQKEEHIRRPVSSEVSW